MRLPCSLTLQGGFIAGREISLNKLLNDTCFESEFRSMTEITQ